MKQISKVTFIVVLTLILSSFGVFAEDKEEVNWSFIETENFKVIYHQQVKEQAYQVAEIAEGIYKEQTKFTGFKKFRKIAIVVTGENDIANGLAVPRDVVHIYVNPLYTDTRVDGEWLKNVVTHELTHIFQTEATFGNTYVLHKITGSSTFLGFPPNVYNPLWLKEGAAQYGSSLHGYDSLDRKRLMVMEQKIKSDKFYTDEELIWAQSPIGGEAYYNFGFGFFNYLMEEYGEEKFLKLQKTHNDYYFLGLSNTIRMVYDKPLNQLIAGWKESLQERFPVRTDRTKVAKLISKPELAQWDEPVITKDGQLIFAESHINLPSVRIKSWSEEKGTSILLDNPLLMLTRLSLSSDDEKLLYTGWDIKDGNLRSDLYQLDLTTQQTERLTENQRIIMGTSYHNGHLVVKNDWGTLHLYYLENGELTRLTNNDYNLSITDIAVSPDQQKVAVNLNYNGRRGIGILNPGNWNYEKIYFPPDGKDWILGDFVNNQQLTLSWDRLDHYDLYRLNVETGLTQQISNTREDILDGQIQGDYWYGQIYGEDGFTVARGKIESGEKLTIKPENVQFTKAAEAQVNPVTKGEYNHMAQLRHDVFLPQISAVDMSAGVAGLLTEPKMELTTLYDFRWNFKENTPVMTLETAWAGTNPGFNLALSKDADQFSIDISETYNKFPYSITGLQSLEVKDNQLQVERVGLQLAKNWQIGNPGQTYLAGSYYLPTATSTDGYNLGLGHTQTFPVGYRGDQLKLNTKLQYANGSVVLPWGESTNLLWVEDQKHQAQALLSGKIKYRHNLADLTTNIYDLVQTGRLYSDLFGEMGVFYEDDQYKTAEMFGVGLELETKLFHMIPVNYNLQVGANADGDYKFKYFINSPF